LAVVNYDTNNLHLAPYDWRLSFWNLEERDGYFSKLKSTIEEFKYGLRSWTVHCLLIFGGIGSGRRGKLSSSHTPWEQLFVMKLLAFFSVELTTISGYVGE
jgi:hypothetical protein